MTIYKVNLDDLIERITLQIIDLILELENSEIRDESKYEILAIYIFNAKKTYDIMLHAGEKFKGTDIPIIDAITQIDNNVINKIIIEKEGWLQTKNLIDKAGQLAHITGIAFDIDLEIVKNEITDDIIYTIEDYDTKIKDKASAYNTFYKAMDGINGVYAALSTSLNLSVEERRIPLLIDVLSIQDIVSERGVNKEEGWNYLKEKIKIDLAEIDTERYESAITKSIPWLKEQIGKSPDKKIAAKTESIKKNLGPEFEKEMNQTIYLGLKAALARHGISVGRGKSVRREDILIMRMID